VRRWLTGLARTAGLSRGEAAGQADELLARVGLAGAAHRPLRELSRGNVQRALLAQALVGPPELVVLDEPSGGLDRDGLGRLTAEIRWAADRSSVVLVARHPTAPLPLPAGPSWRIGDGAVRVEDRAADAAPVMEVETGDGRVPRVSEGELPAAPRSTRAWPSARYARSGRWRASRLRWRVSRLRWLASRQMRRVSRLRWRVSRHRWAALRYR
jgi:energy-coupling factor transporter ATP-binding protein EcfA2